MGNNMIEYIGDPKLWVDPKMGKFCVNFEVLNLNRNEVDYA